MLISSPCSRMCWWRHQASWRDQRSRGPCRDLQQSSVGNSLRWLLERIWCWSRLYSAWICKNWYKQLVLVANCCDPDHSSYAVVVVECITIISWLITSYRCSGFATCSIWPGNRTHLARQPVLCWNWDQTDWLPPQWSWHPQLRPRWGCWTAMCR